MQALGTPGKVRYYHHQGASLCKIDTNIIQRASKGQKSWRARGVPASLKFGSSDLTVGSCSVGYLQSLVLAYVTGVFCRCLTHLGLDGDLRHIAEQGVVCKLPFPPILEGDDKGLQIASGLYHLQVTTSTRPAQLLPAAKRERNRAQLILYPLPIHLRHREYQQCLLTASCLHPG